MFDVLSLGSFFQLNITKTDHLLWTVPWLVYGVFDRMYYMDCIHSMMPTEPSSPSIPSMKRLNTTPFDCNWRMCFVLRNSSSNQNKIQYKKNNNHKIYWTISFLSAKIRSFIPIKMCSCVHLNTLINWFVDFLFASSRY